MSEIYHVYKLARPLPFLQDGAKKIIYIRATTNHSSSSYGQPVLIDHEGNLWDVLMLASYNDTGKIKRF